MGSEFQHCTIGDLCDSGCAALQTGPFGSQLHASDYTDTGIAVVPTEAIQERRIDHSVLPRINEAKARELRRHRLEAGDILFARRGAQATGRVALVRPSEVGFLCGTGAIRLRLGDEVSSDYVSHVLSSPATHAWLRTRAIGATMPNLNRAVIRSVPLSLPPLSEQTTIGRFLTSFDDKIELNRRTNHTLESISRAIFKSWFVDFDPVRKKMEDRTGGELGLPPSLAARFPDTLVSTSIGPVPRGWDVRDLASLVHLVTERVEANGEKDQERYVALDDMPSRSVDLNSWRAGSNVNSSITRFHAGDILFGSMRPYFHKVGLAPFRGITRTTTFVLRPVSDVLQAFALMQLSSDEVVEYATTCSVGSTIPYVRWGTLGAYRVAVPPEVLLGPFQAICSDLFARMHANSESGRLLEDLRDVLLPRLITGLVTTNSSCDSRASTVGARCEFR